MASDDYSGFEAERINDSGGANHDAEVVRRLDTLLDGGVLILLTVHECEQADTGGILDTCRRRHFPTS